MGTNYSFTIHSTDADMLGNTESWATEANWNDRGYASSEDAKLGGGTVLGANGFNKHVASVDQLADADVVTVDGLPMTWAQAKQHGLTGQVASALGQGEASAKKANYTANELEAKKAASQVNKPTTESQEGKDPISDRLEKGLTTESELIAYEGIAESVGFNLGLDLEDVTELGLDMVMGNIADDDEIWQATAQRGIHKDVLQKNVDYVRAVAVDQIFKELGKAQAEELGKWAEQSRSVYQFCANHAVNRMRGKSNDGWQAVYEICKKHMSR